MNIQLSKNEFLKAFTLGGSCAGRTKLLPILDYVKVIIKNGNVRFSSFDNENGISVKMNCNLLGTEDCVFLLPYKDVLSYVKLISDEMFILIIEDSNITIKTKKGKATFSTLDAKDFPEVGFKEDTQDVEFKSSDLAYYLSNSIKFTNIDELRPILGGIYLTNIGGKYNFVATDSHAMSVIQVDETTDRQDGEISKVFNRNCIPILLNALKYDDTCIIKVGNTNTTFKIGDTFIISRNIVGVYPNYNAVIPKNNTLQIALNKKEVADSISRCMLSSSRNMVKLNFSSNGSLEISAEDFDFGKSSIETLTLDCNFDLTIGFDAIKFIDCLNSFCSDSVNLSLSNATMAGLFTCDDNSDLRLLMPLMLN